jgi:hypothetical protein
VGKDSGLIEIKMNWMMWMFKACKVNTWGTGHQGTLGYEELGFKVKVDI